MAWLLWLVVLVAGVAGASFGSRAAVEHALAIADQFGVSAGLVGVSIVAIGTDLPEIANSISASVTGHGDVNVGDSSGSALTQITLVLAILIFTNSAAFESQSADSDSEGVVKVAGGVTVLAVLLALALVADGTLGRLDGFVLMSVWAASMFGLARSRRPRRLLQPAKRRRANASLAKLLAWLGLVGVASIALVQAFIRLADMVGVPELVASTVVLAIGTSLPELVVDWTAIRRGAMTLALGDLFGSSLVDATLSIGIGPTIRENAVSGSAVVSLAIVAIGIAASTVLVSRSRVVGPALGAWLLAVYVACSIAFVVLAWDDSAVGEAIGFVQAAVR